jgi:hypothetical protein
MWEGNGVVISENRNNGGECEWVPFTKLTK